MRQATLGEDTMDSSIDLFKRLINFNRLFENIKKGLKKDQKDLVFNRKSKKEQEEYFNFMKILFTSPDKVS